MKKSHASVLRIVIVRPDRTVVETIEHRFEPLPRSELDAASRRRRLGRHIQRTKDQDAAVIFFFSALYERRTDDIWDAIQILARTGAITTAFKKLSKRRPTSAEREAIHSVWTTYGASLREIVANDRLLLETLRATLPPYDGGDLLLYRGETITNHRRRTYGPSWTTSKDAARMFAQRSRYAMGSGGAVVVEALVTAEAIMCGPNDHSRSLTEDEYIVDRRKLGDVRVIETL